MSKVCLLLDAAVEWQHLSTLDWHGDRRSYYVAPAPYRLLVMTCNGLLLGNMRNRTVDATIGVDRADPGFARVVGELQTKISIYRVISAEPDEYLSRVLRVCHRD
jgi:hypothetical protein